jgi:hypothetical protein
MTADTLGTENEGISLIEFNLIKLEYYLPKYNRVRPEEPQPYILTAEQDVQWNTIEEVPSVSTGDSRHLKTIADIEDKASNRAFFIWQLRNATPFSEDEHTEMLRLLGLWKNSRHGAFLNLLKLENISFYWSDALNFENGVMGAFNIAHPNSIYLMKNISPDPFMGDIPFYKYDWLLTLIDTAIHELTHMFQFKFAKISYIIHSASIRYLPGSIEEDAEMVQAEARKFYDEIQKDIHKQYGEQRIKYQLNKIKPRSAPKLSRAMRNEKRRPGK